MRLHRSRPSHKWVLMLLFPIIIFATTIGLRSSYSYFQPKTPSSTSRATSSDYREYNRVHVVHSSSPPRVDRSILTKLESLDADECLTEASTRPSWPPKVTRLPIEKTPHLLLSNSLRDPMLDTELCKTTPCRLLLPTYIGEQESKARRHLLQLFYLAETLNRTLVLPNVGRSRMGSCSKWDFGFYYELAELHHAQVSFVAFRQWVALRGTRPRAQAIEVLPAPWDTADDRSLVTFNASDLPDLMTAEVAIYTSSDPAKMSHNHCLHGRATKLHFGHFSSVYIYPRASTYAPVRHSSTRGNDLSYFGQGLIAALSSPVIAMESRRYNDTKLGEPDVLLLSWEIRHSIFSLASDETLPYATRWTKIAKSLSTRLQPFIAVHWRMEGVPVSSLLSCAPLLISSITSLLVESTEITSVYLATDFPTEGLDKPHSSSFHVGEEHQTVMKLFETAFAEAPELNGVELTNLVRELRIGGLVPESFSTDDLDPGLMGIIDKMVSTRATLFISGGPRCGKKSSFTGQIIDERKRAKASSHPGLIDTVNYFG